MPLCPQITNTPITVTLTADFTVTDVIPVLPADTEQLDGIIVILDGKTKAYYQTTEPTTGLNEGDIWFDTDDGNKQYFYTGTAWVSVQDTAIAAADAAAVAAAAAATAAQTTADGKNKVFRQTSAPTATATGDLWFDTDDDNRIYRWSGSSWVANDLGTNALANFSANKITSGSIDASVVTVSNLNAGNISTGTLNADRIASASITGTKIAAGTITASNITSGTITASQIATGTITATQIAAGTITTTQLATGTLSATNITTGTLSATVALSATTGTVGGFNIGTTFLSSGAGGTGFFINSSSGNSSFAAVAASGTITAGTGLVLTTGTCTVSAGGNAFNNVGAISAASVATTGAISAGTTLEAVTTLTVGGTATFNGANNSFPNITTSASAANVRWGTTGGGRIFQVVPSSERFKENIVDLDTVYELKSEKLLQLPIRAFTYKTDCLSLGDERSEIMVPGFITEEMDAIYPIAVDYENGLPHNWNDKYIIPGMLALIQDQEKRIKALEGE